MLKIIINFDLMNIIAEMLLPIYIMFLRLSCKKIWKINFPIHHVIIYFHDIFDKLEQYKFISKNIKIRRPISTTYGLKYGFDIVTLCLTEFKDIDIKFIQCLVNLQALYCGYSNILTDNELQYLTSLQVLDCGFNTNFTDVSLSKLTKLQELYCGSNINFTDKGLTKLTQLKKLYCSANINFTDEGVKSLPNLQRRFYY